MEQRIMGKNIKHRENGPNKERIEINEMLIYKGWKIMDKKV